MSYSGKGRKKILIIGEYPGFDEDKYGMHCVGRTGQFFEEILKENGINMREDCWLINALNCIPLDQRGNLRSGKDIKIEEIEACYPFVESTIKKLKPEFIWLFGGKPIDSLYRKDFSKRQVSLFRGLCIPDKEHRAYVCPIYNPAYIIRNESDKNLFHLFKRDIKNAVQCLKKKKFEHKDIHIHKLTRLNDILDALNYAYEHAKDFFFDYETTGIKPQINGMKIVSMSFSFIEGEAYSYPISYRDFFTKPEVKQIADVVVRIMLNASINKSAHNLKFEDLWTRHIFKIDALSLDWCSMIATHIIDNRPYFTNLDFQNFVNFGIRPYGKHIERYKKNMPGSPFNKMDECPLDDLLEYGGYDSAYGRMLVPIQMDHIEKTGRLMEAYNFFHEGALELSYVQDAGINTDEEYYHEEEKRLEKEILKLETELLHSREAKLFEAKTGKTINLGSSQDISYLIYDVLGHKVERKTDNDNPSVDVTALEDIKTEFNEKLIKIRRYNKIKDTYLSMFKRESYKGKMYPSEDLNTVTSYRSSISGPSFQNIPIRDEDAKKSCRRGIIPSKGNMLLEWDYSQIEVCTGCFYHLDPNMIKYVTNKSTDQHRDAGMDLFLLDINQITKDIRFYAKNKWTFAQFYGDYYASCAKNLWRLCLDLKTNDGITLREHLKRKGIHKYSQFEKHCEEVERIFWGKRFQVYNEWKKDINDFYNRHGFIETLMGFRFTDLMSPNQASNFPIQGTAFHLLLWTLIRVNEIAREEKWKTKIIGQIHDAGLNDQDPNELEHVIKTINEVGTIWIRDEFPWINVPLEMEFELTPIDGSWYEKKEYKCIT